MLNTQEEQIAVLKAVIEKKPVHFQQNGLWRLFAGTIPAFNMYRYMVDPRSMAMLLDIGFTPDNVANAVTLHNQINTIVPFKTRLAVWKTGEGADAVLHVAPAYLDSRVKFHPHKEIPKSDADPSLFDAPKPQAVVQGIANIYQRDVVWRRETSRLQVQRHRYRTATRTNYSPDQTFSVSDLGVNDLIYLVVRLQDAVLVSDRAFPAYVARGQTFHSGQNISGLVGNRRDAETFTRNQVTYKVFRK